MRRMSWTISIPLKNIRTFILLRPPAVVFCLCIACFGIVTLGLGLYIRNTNHPLKNPDAVSWNDVANKLNKLNFCLLPPNKSPMFNTTGMEAVSVPFEMQASASKIWKNYTLVSGSVMIESLGFHEFSGSNLSFSFSLMDSQTRICLNLYHPKDIPIPQAISSCNALQFNPLPRSTGAVVLPPSEDRPNKPLAECPDDDQFQLHLLENPNWEVFLKEEQITLASTRLLITSAILIAMFVYTLCYAALHGGISRSKTGKSSFLHRHVESGKEPLNS